VTPRRADVVVYCEGPPDAPHPRRIVERYRWKTEQGEWVQTNAGHAAVLIYPGDTTQDTGPDGPPPERRKWQHRCTDCPYNVPVKHERMTFILASLTAHRVDSLSLLALGEQSYGATIPNKYSSPKTFRRRGRPAD